PGGPGGAIIDLDPEIVGGQPSLEGGMRQWLCRSGEVLLAALCDAVDGKMTAAAVGRGIPEPVGGDRIAIAVRSREQRGGRKGHRSEERRVGKDDDWRMASWQ